MAEAVANNTTQMAEAAAKQMAQMAEVAAKQMAQMAEVAAKQMAQMAEAAAAAKQMAQMAEAVAKQETEADDTTVIDMELPLNPAYLWRECCIYKVPKELRIENEKAYTPKLISIGPLHHGKKELRSMQMVKLRYVRNFFYRTGKSQGDFQSLIDKQFEKAFTSYSECDLSGEDFIKVILLDAIFIIELFLKTFKNSEDKTDEILSKPWLKHAIWLDLMLLENQIPYFVLKKLYRSAFMNYSRSSDRGTEEREEPVTPLLELACNYFSVNFKDKPVEKEVKHFTDLLRTFHCRPFLSKTVQATRDRDETMAFIPTVEAVQLGPTPMKHLYNARKLDEAGVKFKAVEVKVSLLDIKFQKNICLDCCPCFNFSWLSNCFPCLKDFPCLVRMQPFLEFPQLVVEDHRTEALFRNLMALEQCHYPFETYFCNYVGLWNLLVSTEKDMEFLVDAQVIRNQLGSNDAVATLIKNLCPKTGDAGSIYHDLSQRLNGHCDNPWNRILATMSSVYFRDIWRGSTTVVGLIVLGLTCWNFLMPYVR